MPTLSTGLIIAGAYADKVRRTLFAQLRDRIKQGEITNQEVARAAGELNRIIYEILVNKLKIDKGDVVRVRVDYDITDGKIIWDYKTLRVEAFKRVPDNDVEKVLKEALPEALKQFVEVVEEKVEEKIEEKIEEAKPEEKPLERIEALPVTIADAVLLGELSYGGYVVALQNDKGDNIGLATIEEKVGNIVIDTIIVGEGKAYRIYVSKAPITIDDVKEDAKKVIDIVLKHRPVEIPIEEARKIIEERLRSIT